MSDPTPPIPQEILPLQDVATPTPTRNRSWAISEIVAWVLILFAVVSVVVLNVREKLDTRAKSSDERLEILVFSRYTMGTHHLMQSLRPTAAAIAASAPGTIPAPLRVAPELELLLDELDKKAKGPADRFRTAIVRGSFETPESAQDRLDQLGQAFPGMQGDADTVRDLHAGTLAASDPRWKSFEKQYGWFAAVAASENTPKGSPERQAVANAGYRTMGAMALGVSLALGGALAGLVLFIIAIVFITQNRVKKAFGRAPPLPPDRRGYAQAFAVYLAGTMALAYGFSFFLPDIPRLLRVSLLPFVFLTAIFWPLIVGRQRWADWRNTLGLHAGRGILREIGAGLVGYTAGFPVFILGTIITILLARFFGVSTSHPINEALTQGPAMLALVFIAASVWAPITEELMFRGALFAHLRERYGWWVSAPLVALIFAVIHPQGWAAIPALAALALVFAGIREWRGSIIGCMAAHAMHNTVTLAIVTLMLS